VIICDYIQIYRFYNPLISSATQRLALAAGRTGKTPPQTSTIASKPAPYPQGEALSAARIVGHPSRRGFGRLNHQLDNQP
jgi:hypothetical protein